MKPKSKIILSLLLAICLVTGLLPTTVFAENNDKAIQLGTSALNENVNTESAATVFFGKNDTDNAGSWHVIGYDGNGVVSTAGNITLLATVNMGLLPFNLNNTSSNYAGSNLKTAVDNLAGKLTTEETAAVIPRTLESGSYIGINTDCVEGSPVDNAVFWPLSPKEANSLNANIRKLDKQDLNWEMYFWWLRSPGSNDFNRYHAAAVRCNGVIIHAGHIVTEQYGVRPAFNLNLDSVLFTSAAEGGKSSHDIGANALKAVNDCTGNDWKLTLRDEGRQFDAAVTKVDSTTMTITYSGATLGENEYISAIVKGNDDTIKYYGRIAQPVASDGEAGIDLSGVKMESDDKLFVFSEQYNGDKATDYASNLIEIPINNKNSYNVSATLTNMNFSGKSYAKTGEDYDATLSATQGYVLPKSIEVKVGGTALTTGDSTYTYDATTGTVTISSSAVTGDIEIFAVGALPQETTPEASFTATGKDSGTLTEVDTSMKYSLDDGTTWVNITSTTMDITGVTANKDIKVYKPGNGTTTSDSETQIIDVTQAAMPAGISKTDCTTAAQNDGAITNVDNTMEYRLSTGSEWMEITGTEVTGLANGTYDVRVKANGTVLASAVATVTIDAHICAAQDDWQHDANKHWKICACGEKIGKAATHTGGTSTCAEKAVCDVCGEEYGENNASNHTNLVKTKAKPATHMTEGNREYWYCNGCHKYFSNEVGTQEIALEATVLPKLTEHTADETGWHFNETNHWNTCECGEKLNETAHTFEWVTDKKATADESGSKHEECTVCRYAKAAVKIPATGNNTQLPKTGDNSNMTLWITIMLVVGTALIGTVLYRCKKKYSR